MELTTDISFTILFYPHISGLGPGDDISGGVFGGKIINGSSVNIPIDKAYKGYTSADAYDHDQNNAWIISADNPSQAAYLTVGINSSLISATSRVYTGEQTHVNRAQVLTVLPTTAFDDLPGAATSSDCFRPHYYGSGAKTIIYCETEMDDTFLTDDMALISEQGQGLPDIVTSIAAFAKPWIRNISDSAGGLQPLQNMPPYYMAAPANDAALVLNSSDYTLEQKQPLLINYIQCGIDLLGPFVEGSQGYLPDGGTMQGFLGPVACLGKTFEVYFISEAENNPAWVMFAKSGVYRYTGEYSDGNLPTDYNYFHELDQTYYVMQIHVDITNDFYRGSGEYLEGYPAWTGSGTAWITGDINTPVWGIRHSNSPTLTDNSFPSADYELLNAIEYPSLQIALLAWDVKDNINHNAWFDYTDRWASYWSAINDRSSTRVWSAYRHLYGPIWPHTLTTQYSKGTNLSSNIDNELTTIFSRYPINVNNIYGTSLTSNKNYTVFLFKNKHTEKNKISIQCRLRSNWAPLYSTVYLQIFNRITTSWETIDSNNIKNADENFILSGTVTSNLNSYFDNNYWISCRIYQMFM